MIDTKYLIEYLQSLYEELQDIPTMDMVKDRGIVNPDTYARRFGSWNKALEFCIGKIKRCSPVKSEPHPCAYCGSITKNRRFCSKSCTAKMTNTYVVKRKKKVWLCEVCGKIISKQSSMCKGCYCKSKIFKESGNKTIGMFHTTHARHRHQHIRNHAHNVMKFYGIPKQCVQCGYSLHVELCHIKDICKFDKKAMLSEVNSLNNLAYLCRNHHWELGNGFLTIDILNECKNNIPAWVTSHKNP
jgi:hypothetical protein